jgi:hypothetical protein
MMREISIELKLRVVKLFLTGLPYDEIVTQLSISKGSVVNIIDDFRDGMLLIPPGMTEYVDELRRIAVDLKKHNTNIPQLQSYLRLHTKLREMGVDGDKTSEWLDITQELACRSESSKSFVDSALELKRLTSQTGLTYESLVRSFNLKLEELGNIERHIEAKHEELQILQNKYDGEQKRSEEILASVTAAIASAREDFHKQQRSLRLELNEYLVNSKLSWRRIRLIEAVIDTGLKGSGLTSKQREKIRSEIISAGSINSEIDELETKRNKLKSKVKQLSTSLKTSTREVNKLRETMKDLTESMNKVINTKRDIDHELALANTKLGDLNRKIDEKVENFYMTHIMLDFLFNPNSITNDDFEVLTNVMNIIRNNRLGMQPRQAVNRSLTLIYKGRLPKAYRDFNKHRINIDLAREAFAFLLTPLLKDKLVSKYQYDMLKSGYEVIQDGGKTIFKAVSSQDAHETKPVVLILPPAANSV